MLSGSYPKTLPIWMSYSVFPWFLSSNLMVLDLKFRSDPLWADFAFFACICMPRSSFPTHLLKRASCLLGMTLAPLSKRWSYMCWLIPGVSNLLHGATCLFWCQYQVVLVLTALWYILKSNMWYVQFYFYFTTWEVLQLPMNFRLFSDLRRMSLVIWLGSHWTPKLLWITWTFDIKPSKAGAWKMLFIFVSSMIFLNCL